MQAASLLDGFSFDLFPPFENGLAAPEVDVSRRQVVQALVVSTVVVVPDELLDALFELSWQVVVVQQDPVFHRAMISLDLALRHRGRTTAWIKLTEPGGKPIHINAEHVTSVRSDT